MSKRIEHARSGLIGCICYNCGKTFYTVPPRIDPLCNACKQYFQRPDVIQNPANELAIRLYIARMNEAIRNTQ